jgi:long-chain acyl-CoA synthetase
LLVEDAIELKSGVLAEKTFRSTEELLDRSARAATGLTSLGVAQGDSVALLLRNDHPFFEASFGASMVGASAVPINWHGTAAEIQYVIEDSGARVLIAHFDLLERLSNLSLDGVQVFVVEPSPATPGLEADLIERCGREVTAWSKWLEEFSPSLIQASPIPLSMIYTSGTTGRPKGVRRLPTKSKKDTLVANDESYAILGIEAGMRTVIVGPMYHTAPNGYGLAAASLGGFVVLEPKFDPEGLLGLIEQYRITHLYLVPTMFVRLLRLTEEQRTRYDLSSLAHVVHAAAPCPPQVKRAMIEWWGPVVYEFYGATETGVVAGCSSSEWLAHPGTVGRELSGVTIRTLDEEGRQTEPGSPGEVFARNPAASEFTYEGMPEARAEIERDGLITAGDIGYLDEDRFLYLCDRKRDLIISGGVNIYPAEIESCLQGLRGIADVAVFGVPDEEYGESVAAAIELISGAEIDAEDVRSYVREHLAGFKAPKIVTFHDELPREDSGKIFKRHLRDPYWANSNSQI